MRKEIVFLLKPLNKAYFIFKMTGPAVVRPASSGFWKAPLAYTLAFKRGEGQHENGIVSGDRRLRKEYIINQ